MTIAKITAGDGYTYLTNHVARGDAGVGGARDAAAYYTAQGNPPGMWTGRGAPLLGLAAREVTEEQMLSLFGLGQHPDGNAISTAYIREHVRAKMTDRQLDQLRDRAIAAARLGRPFPSYEVLEPFDARVAARLEALRRETGREPTATEEKRARAQEARRQRAAVAGFDLVFSPVKSAAVLWAVDPRSWVRDAVRDAHQAAVRDAMELLEEHAAFTRTGHGGIAQVPTNGLTAAAFEHWDSRAGDPNLHTHVAVSSKVQGTDGKWRALDARALYRVTVAVSEAYNTAFEAHLTARLGVSFTARPDTLKGREPVREISGVPLSVIGFFSRRRAAIEARYAELVREYRTAHGHDPAPGVGYDLARRANLDTRQDKKPPLSLTDKRAAWCEELSAAFGEGAVRQLMSAVPAQPAPEVVAAVPSPEALHEIANRVVAAVSASRSTWTVWNLRAEAERQIRATIHGMHPEQHRNLADTVTSLAASPGRSVSVEAPSLLDEPTELRRADGSSVFAQHGAARYTSQVVLDAESRLVNATRTPTACGLAGPSAAAALDGFEAVSGTSLDAGQRELVTAFACDSRLLLAGIGPAGAGKTTAMRALSHVLRDSGQLLIPLATSAAAADVLGRELGVRAENLHKFIHEWTAGPFADRLRAGESVPEQARMFRLHPGDVILVDEAGMAGTFLLDQLVSLATGRGAVVRLLGDDRQLPAVEGGGALRLVAAQPGTPQLTHLYRFRDPAEGAATLQLRAGDAGAIDWYHDAGRIRSGSREAMAAAAYNGWKNDMLAGKVTLMAADGSDISELSAQARADRVAAGQVESDGVRLRDGNLAGQGDWIVTRQNQRRLGTFGGRDWVKNGDGWEVTSRLPDGSLRARHLDHRGYVILPAGYVRDHVQLLYATSAHRAQGATVDTAHPLITAGMSRESLYVLATRAREKTTFYVATHDQPFDDDDRIDQVRRDSRQYAGREILLNILSTEAVPLSATEAIATAQEEAASLATLVPRYLHAAREDADARYQLAAASAFGHKGARALAADSAWGAVVRRLYDAEGDGWDPARLLATVAAKRELGSADSIAEVLAWRIDAFLTDSPQPLQPADARAETGPSRAGSAVPRAYETAASACDRLAALALTALGPQVAGRAQSETAWPALVAALRRAEDAGYSPADALTRTATSRELHTARSASEVLAWRINYHLAAQPSGDADGRPLAEPGSRVAALLPWAPGPRQVPEGGQASLLTTYISDAAAVISARIDTLADSAVRQREPWVTALGQRPDDPARARQWLRHVAVIAAYRDQYKVTSDDPRQVLGPYAGPDHAGHKAYWHAAGSVLAARQLARAEPAASSPASSQATSQLAADIYRSLPPSERAAVTEMITAAPGSPLPGNPPGADDYAVAQPAYARQLTNALTARGHLTSTAGHHPGQQAAVLDAPLESGHAQRAQRRPGKATRPATVHTMPEPQPNQHVLPPPPSRVTGRLPTL